jgi:parvulin-like peptidyl-prolyl isomerase
VTADDVKKYFDEHQDEIGQRRASDIMFTYTGATGAPPTVKRTKEEAKRLADELLKKLRTSADADFVTLVKSMSDGPSARDNGDLGFVPKKAGTIETIAEAVYKLQKVGDYSDVVESPFGFHVIKLTQIREENDIAGEIKDRITSERFGAEMQKLMESAIAKAKFNKKLM